MELLAGQKYRRQLLQLDWPEIVFLAVQIVLMVFIVLPVDQLGLLLLDLLVTPEYVIHMTIMCGVVQLVVKMDLQVPRHVIHVSPMLFQNIMIVYPNHHTMGNIKW
jgi:hypothetical protein